MSTTITTPVRATHVASISFHGQVATSWTIFRVEHSKFLVIRFRTVGPPSISCIDPPASSKSSPAHPQHYCSHWLVLVAHFL